jgi:limonene-1,2-epoxide hydrolase
MSDPMSKENDPMDAEGRVAELCKAFSRMDVDELLDFFAEDAIYEKMPVGRFAGHDQIRGTLEEFFGPDVRVEMEILKSVASGGTVMHERLVHFAAGDKKISLPAMAIFEVAENGKISAWRDYFDRGHAGLA